MKLLVAIDGSENSLRALDSAISLAGKTNGSALIGLVNAHDDLGLRGASQFVGNKAVTDYLHEQSETELRDAVARLQASGVPFETKAVRGSPAEAIAATATEGHYDLVFLGSKGRSALGDLLMGSVAQRVIEHCPVPVVLVR